MRIIDGIFGSNETSRAIASIITLVHRELMQDPDFELAKKGKMAILGGLTKAMTAFAVLQYVTHRRMMKQVKVTVLWQGLVVDKETSSQALIHFQDKSTEDRSQHTDIVMDELERFLERGMDEDTQQRSADESLSCLSGPEGCRRQVVHLSDSALPYDMYEITTATRRTTTTTTRIQPIDPTKDKDNQPTAKYVVVKSNEEDKQAFMAVIDREDVTQSSDTRRSLNEQEKQLVLAPTQEPNGRRPSSGLRIMLSALSQRFRRKKVERTEDYAKNAPNSMDTDMSTSRTMTSTSEVMQSTTTTQYNHDASLSGTKMKRRPSSWNDCRIDSHVDLFEKGIQAVKKRRGFDNLSLPKLSRKMPRRRFSTSNASIPTMTSLNADDSPYLRPRVYRSNSMASRISSISQTFITTTTFASTSSPSTSTTRDTPNVTSHHHHHSNENNNRERRLSTRHPSSAPSNDLDTHYFPRSHLVNNLARFMRYASAAYGESFMRIFGIGNIPSVLPSSHHHHPNHHAFAHHTGLSVQDILLSSYTDRSSLTMHHPSLHELVHYVTVDHASQAIVLTCRGTLGLSDVLIDLTCSYARVAVPNMPARDEFKAHGGMLEAAQVLAKEKGKVFRAVRDGLLLYPNYGLVLCGHSLGGGVASLLGVLWGEKATASEGGFVISSSSGLPAGRPIHCYVYGPPCVMSLELSEYCASGLVTSIVHGYDIVSCLSLGLLRDFKNVAASLHTESHVADEILGRVMRRYLSKEQDQQRQGGGDDDDEEWFWALIKTMRADMRSEKLYPPGTVYMIESVPQLARSETQTFKGGTAAGRESHHKQANTVTLSRCDDKQARFSEIVFSRTMFMDHSPNMYEKAIRSLCRGFFGQSRAYEDL